MRYDFLNITPALNSVLFYTCLGNKFQTLFYSQNKADNVSSYTALKNVQLEPINLQLN